MSSIVIDSGSGYNPDSVFMIKEYGLAEWESFVVLSKKPCTIKEFEWLKFADYYREKYNGLRSLGL